MSGKTQPCPERIRRLLALRPSGDLTSDELARVEDEMRYSADCRSEAESFEKVVAALQQAATAPTPVDDRPSLWSRIEPGLGPAGLRRQPREPWVPTRWLAVACGFLALVTVYGEFFSVSGPRIVPNPAMLETVEESLLPRGAVCPSVGISVQPLEGQMARMAGTTDGAVISDVANGSAAQRAGLQAGDVVVEVDGIRVRSPADLTLRLDQVGVGSRVQLTIIRGGKTAYVDVLIGFRASFFDPGQPTPIAPAPRDRTVPGLAPVRRSTGPIMVCLGNGARIGV